MYMLLLHSITCYVLSFNVGGVNICMLLLARDEQEATNAVHSDQLFWLNNETCLLREQTAHFVKQ